MTGIEWMWYNLVKWMYLNVASWICPIVTIVNWIWNHKYCTAYGEHNISEWIDLN